MISLGRRIKVRRILCWLSQEEFARRVGVSRRQVLYWESEEDAPSVESMAKICGVLHVSMDWMVTGRGWLRDVHDQEFYLKQQAAYISQLTSEHFKIRLFAELPLNFAAKSFPAFEVLAEDRDAIALSVKTDAFEPYYLAGDVLLMRPLNLRFNSETQPTTEEFGSLHEAQAATVVNGRADLSVIKIKRAGERKVQAELRSLRKRAAKTIIGPDDDFVVQAVAYKSVRVI